MEVVAQVPSKPIEPFIIQEELCNAQQEALINPEGKVIYKQRNQQRGSYKNNNQRNINK